MSRGQISLVWFVGLSIPVFLLSMFWSSEMSRYGDTLRLATRYFSSGQRLLLLPGSPYLHFIAGLYLGLLLALLPYRPKSERSPWVGRITLTIWGASLVAIGVGAVLSGDALLVISFLAVYPGMAYWSCMRQAEREAKRRRG